MNEERHVNRPSGTSGFTFIEILVAMAIFVMAVLAAVNIASGSVKAAQDAKEVSIATWLLQQKMVEAETRLETEGMEKGCDEEKRGQFEEPHERFSWVVNCGEVDFRLSETAAQMAQQEDEDAPLNRSSENQILKLILETANKHISESVRELHVKITWKQGNTDRTVDATTHFARFDQKVQLPGGLGALGGAASGGSGGEDRDEGGN